MIALHGQNHIDCVSKTISRNIGVMNKLKHFVPTRILHILYCTLVLPYLNYSYGSLFEKYWYLSQFLVFEEQQNFSKYTIQ